SRVSGQLTHDAGRRAARLVADARAHHADREGPGQGHQAHDASADPDAADAELLADMTKSKRHTQRGMALIAAMIFLAITLMITSEFGTASNIDLTAAANYRDQMRSMFLARSASGFGEL